MKYLVSFEVNLTDEEVRAKFEEINGEPVEEGEYPSPTGFIESELGWLQSFGVEHLRITKETK